MTHCFTYSLGVFVFVFVIVFVFLFICVPLPFLNSYWHGLSENVRVWGRVLVRSAGFNLWAKCPGWPPTHFMVGPSRGPTIIQFENWKTGLFPEKSCHKGYTPPPLYAVSEGQKQSRNVCISTLYIKCDFYQTQPGSPRSDNCLVLLILSSMLILNL